MNHAGAGLDQNSSSLVGVTAVYPQYIDRSGKIVTIEDRINGCMVRSMNGEKFETNSDELTWRMTTSTDEVPTPSFLLVRSYICNHV